LPSGATCTLCTVAFSPDGHILAAAGNDGVILLWNVTNPSSPQPLATQNVGSTIYSLAFSSDGRTLAAGQFNGKVTLWNVTEPARLRLDRTLAPVAVGTVVLSVAFSPDGRTSHHRRRWHGQALGRGQPSPAAAIRQILDRGRWQERVHGGVQPG